MQQFSYTLQAVTPLSLHAGGHLPLFGYFVLLVLLLNLFLAELLKLVGHVAMSYCCLHYLRNVFDKPGQCS